MLHIKIEQPQTKSVMNKILKEDSFDGFDIRSAVICSFARFEITGVADRDTEGEETAKKQFCKWGELKPYVFNIIRGGQKPKLFKLVFSLDTERTEADFPGAAALFLNVSFERDEINITTGTAQKTFSLDKTVENTWDVYAGSFIKGLSQTV